MAHRQHSNTKCGINPSHAWRCTKKGELGMIVYCQSIAMDKLAEHYDIEIGTVTYASDGSGRQIRWGVV